MYPVQIMFVPADYACPILIKVCFFFSVNNGQKEVHHWILCGRGYIDDSSLNFHILSQLASDESKYTVDVALEQIY